MWDTLSHDAEINNGAGAEPTNKQSSRNNTTMLVFGSEYVGISQLMGENQN